MLILLPILVPLLTAIVLVGCWTRPSVQRIIALGSSCVQLAVAALLLHQTSTGRIVTIAIGAWPPPFGIVLVADILSALMITVTGVVSVAVMVYSMSGIDANREAHGYYPLLSTLLTGVNGAFLTADIFNLYVWFELLLISSFVLTALGGGKGQLEGAVKYVTLNLIASVVFLTATGVLYGIAGTLSMGDLAARIPAIQHREILGMVAVLYLVAFGIKAAMFPLYMWLPASYHTLPAPVGALFSGLLTKVGVYAFYRMFTLVFPAMDFGMTTLILVISGFTMLVGVLGAAVQYEFRRLLSFHIVSQIGYLLFALGVGTPLALAGGIFYTIHNIIAKANLYLIAGVAARLGGSYDIRKLGGLFSAAPWLGILFLVPALSLAGVPPLSGFWAKLAVIRAGLEREHYLLGAVALITSLLTLFSMSKVWSEVFWKQRDSNPETDADPAQRPIAYQVAPIALLAAITLTLGLFAEPLFALVSDAARQLLDPSAYVDAVLRRAP